MLDTSKVHFYTSNDLHSLPEMLLEHPAKVT